MELDTNHLEFRVGFFSTLSPSLLSILKAGTNYEPLTPRIHRPMLSIQFPNPLRIKKLKGLRFGIRGTVGASLSTLIMNQYDTVD